MSPMETGKRIAGKICLHHSNNEELFTEICERERCPFAVVGKTTTEKYKTFERATTIQ